MAGTFTSTKVQPTNCECLPIYRGYAEFVMTEFNLDGTVMCEVTLFPGLNSWCGF